MAFGKIPRFSPTFSPAELATVASHLLRRPDEREVVHRFERAFADYIGTEHAVMVPSARYGLYLILKGLGFGPEDEVVLPALTYWAVPSIALAAGIPLRLADVGLHSHVLEPGTLEAAITPRTRAVVPTHLFGTPCDMPRILELARERDLVVIEDTAQAVGARIGGRRVGSFGRAAYFTFGLTKNMTTLSGAMVTTDDGELAAAIRRELEAMEPAPLSRPLKETALGTAMMVATHPWVYPFAVHPVVVLGNRLGKDPIDGPFGEEERRYERVPTHYRRPRAVQAAVGLTQLSRLDALNAARIANGRYLDEHLAGVPGLELPSYPPGAEPVYTSYVVHHPHREAFARALRERGVDTTVGFMSDLSDHPLFPELRTDSCPNARRAHRELLHLPVHPRLSRRDLEHMVEAVRQASMEAAAH